ncbi:hypothetical protein N7512_009148 [Penicillium capsulatum]|nr:hypothetical protein N7512_009148 [Penicillium capsulatum]
MGSYTFQWPYDASEVFVTGTFDDWGKTVKLDRVGDIFAKKVSVPTGETLPLDFVPSRINVANVAFVVDGTWTTDPKVREANDGNENINNLLLPEEIQELPELTSTDDTPTPAVMSGVTPDSTTAALAADVPKEQLNGNIPGTFPETPGQESEQTLSVNPIPASAGYGNPIKLNPGEKVPDPSTVHGNTVESTVKLDKESYEKGDSVPLGSAGTQNDTAGPSAFAVTPVSKNIIPESSLPMGGPAQRAAAADQEQAQAGGPAQQAAMADPGYTIQSAAPTSTTAALAGEVPLEKNKQTNGSEPVAEVPQVVKNSLAEAHQGPEAAANKEAVDEKKQTESELHQKVGVDESAGAPAPTVSAATQPTAPGLTVPPIADSADVSPCSTPPPGSSRPAPAPSTEPTPAADTQNTGPTHPQARRVGHSFGAAAASPKEEKKKKRISGFFSKIKEKLK